MDGKGRRGMGRGALPSPPPLLARSAPAQATLRMPVNSQAKGERGLPHYVKSTWQPQQTPSLPKTPVQTLSNSGRALPTAPTTTRHTPALARRLRPTLDHKRTKQE